MAHKFDPANAARLEDPERLTWQPPERVLGLLDLRGDETVVDYGAGTGVFTLALLDALPKGRVVAVDLSAELLNALELKLDDERHERTLVVHTTDNRVPLFDGSAQAALAVNLWHEIRDEPVALTEIARLLEPGGRLVVVDWARIARRVGPPGEYVLSVDQALALVTGMGLLVTAIHQPGELFPYHYALVAHKP